MTYVIYEKDTTLLLKENNTFKSGGYAKYYKTEATAKAGRTRLLKEGGWDETKICIAEESDFSENIEKTRQVKSLMSGLMVEERVNLPYYLSASSEAYWSM